MSILNWGKCLLETTTSTNGTPAAQWSAIDTPKEGTVKLTPTAGQEVTALEEGGEIVDSRTAKTTYQLEFDLFLKKGKARQWEDVDGIIQGEHAFRMTPEDEEAQGFLIERASVRCEENYTTADGTILHYVVRCLKPATGKTVKPYTKA